METNEAEKIYNKVKENSIGKEKKSSSKRLKRQVRFAVTTSALVATLAASFFFSSQQQEEKVTPKEIQMEYDGYDIGELSIYQGIRVFDLLDDYGFTDYDGSGYDRNYHYTAEDFKRLKGIDENYLYGFYCVTSVQNFKDVLSGAFDYDSFDHYLLDRNYVDEKGQPDIAKWSAASKQEMADILNEKKGKVR